MEKKTIELPKEVGMQSWNELCGILKTDGELPTAPTGPGMKVYRGKEPPKPFKFVAVGDLELKEPEFLIDGLIEADTLGLLFGDPGCGKSFTAVDLAMSVATGADFHGKSVDMGSVFYIAGEGHNGLARRFHAWAKHQGVTMNDLPLYKSERAAPFLDAASAETVCHAVDEIAAQVGPPRLIIVDTLARNFGDGDENSTADMNRFVASMDTLKDRYPGAVILIVHHTGHGAKERARGAMALKGALDFEYRLEKSGDAMTLACTKMKDAEASEDMHFTLTDVEIQPGIKSAVPMASEAPAKGTSNLTANQRIAVETYRDAAADGKVINDDGAIRGVHMEDWRPYFYAKHTGDTTDTKRKAFQRMRDALTKPNGIMIVQDDVYLLRGGNLE